MPATAGVVTGIVDGQTLQLDLTQNVRIAGILAPPSTAEALRAVLLNQVVAVGNTTTDPRGVTSGSMTRVDGSDVATQLVANGLARVQPLQGDLTVAAKLLPLEASARDRKLGLWSDSADPAFAVATPETAGRLLNTFGIVEGTVVNAAAAKGRYYLNFGPDWKTDFTAELSKPAVNLLALQKIDWTKLADHRVRVRGWIEDRNGPMIMVTAPSQLEVLP